MVDNNVLPLVSPVESYASDSNDDDEHFISSFNSVPSNAFLISTTSTGSDNDDSTPKSSAFLLSSVSESSATQVTPPEPSTSTSVASTSRTRSKPPTRQKQRYSFELHAGDEEQFVAVEDVRINIGAYHTYSGTPAPGLGAYDTFPMFKVRVDANDWVTFQVFTGSDGATSFSFLGVVVRISTLSGVNFLNFVILAHVLDICSCWVFRLDISIVKV